MLTGIWRSDDLHLSPRWTSALNSPHHACIFVNLHSWYRILWGTLFGEITFALNWEPLIKSFLKEIGTKRTLPPLGSSLPLSSSSGRPSRHGYCNESKCWGVFFFLVVCVNEREWVVIYRSRGGMEAYQCAMSAIRVPLYLSPWIKQS